MKLNFRPAALMQQRESKPREEFFRAQRGDDIRRHRFERPIADVDEIVDAAQLAHALGFERAAIIIDQCEAQHGRELG